MTLQRERELCGTCHHGAHNTGPCQTITVTGPPADKHEDRTETACECKQSTPHRNGANVH